MNSVSVWLRAFEILNLPSDAVVLALAPHGEHLIAEALARAARQARLVVLNIYPKARLGAAEDRPDFPLPVERISVSLPDARQRLQPDYFHLALSDHAIEEIVRAAVAHHEGMDPMQSSGGAESSQVLRAVRAYWRTGDLEDIVAPQFIEVVDACRAAVRPRGRLLLSHRVFDSGPRLAYPLELYADYVPFARRWIAEAGISLREISLDGFDPQWWLCLERAD